MVENDNYTGWKVWTPTGDEWFSFYEKQEVPFELLENEYLIVKTEDDYATTYCYENGVLRKFTGGSIKTVKDDRPVLEDPSTGIILPTRRPSKSKTKAKDGEEPVKYSKGKSIVLNPRNVEQACAFDLFKDRSKTIKVVTGTWGTGKTMIMVNAALEALSLGQFDKIIWIRNNVDTAGTKDMGALPGDAYEKLKPFLGPFRDHAGEMGTLTMIKKGTLVVEPLQYLRGRNFENALIMCSEAENLTKEHLQLIIARAAEGSEVWIDGDTRQRDKAIFEKSKGMESLIAKFKGNKLFGYVHLVRSERSETAAMADLLND